ncbi:alpha/beta fold hydrolase, partial [Actinoplanes sp. GCM10030250]|uniref:alpha/beta fold hydrolase n=1 Tax=Actinoplanes sp. GCM10030250 TaxID=3273376 RepID=UPI003621FCE9
KASAGDKAKASAGPLLGYSHGVYFTPAVEDSIGVLDWSLLARTRRIVRYDQRGHGSSTGEPDPASYTWRALADDLLAVADSVAGDEPVDWAGSSLGTASLLWAATKRPDRFRRLILMIPPTVRDDRVAPARTYETAARLVEHRGKNLWLQAMRNFKPPIFADVPTWVFDADVPEPLLPSVMRGAALSDLPGDDALKAIPHPTLILAWEDDPVHPVASARLLAETLPDARLHVSATVADIRKWPARIAEFL